MSVQTGSTVEFVEKSRWRGSDIHWALTDGELLRSRHQSVQRFWYYDIGRMRLLSYSDWNFRSYSRCQMHISGYGHLNIDTDGTEAVHNKLIEFSTELARRVERFNPNRRFRGGIEPVKWAVFLVGHVVLVALSFAIMSVAPRSTWPTIGIAMVFIAYWAWSIGVLVENWPRDFDPAKAKASPTEAVRHFLLVQYDKYIAPIFDLHTFISQPTRLAESVNLHDKRSFGFAIGNISLVLALYVGLERGVASIFEHQAALGELQKIEVYVKVLLLPMTFLLMSFLVTRVAFHYEETSPIHYLHCGLYATAAFVLVEATFAVGWVLINHYAPDLRHSGALLSCPGSGDQLAKCVQSRISAIATRLQFRETLRETLLGMCAILSLLIIRSHVRLSHAAFKIKQLHGYLANISCLIVISIVIWIYRSQ